MALLVGMTAGCAVSSPPVPQPPEVLSTADVAAVDQPWPRREVLDLAVRAFNCGAAEGHVSRPVLTVIDYSLASSVPRLWVIDLEGKRVLHHELVAHGDRSGDTMAVAFSNEIDSHQSSLGLFRTDESYTGEYGYALRLTGLERGVNDNARARAIVVHGAPYVSSGAVAAWGRIGTTWGCMGLPEDVAPQVIDEIAGGSAVFAYYPDPVWLETSRYLHCDANRARAFNAADFGDTTLASAGPLSSAGQ